MITRSAVRITRPHHLPYLVYAAWIAACSSAAVRPAPSMSRAPFGVTPDGDSVDLYTISNGGGLEMRVMTYGATITSLMAPDRAGTPGDIVLGYDSLEGYLRASPYFGAIVGRYANRIAGGTFAIDGTRYRLATNDGVNHLHGGVRGFDKVVWSAEPFAADGEAGVVLRYVSPDGEEGYPGTLSVTVRYALSSTDELIVDYHATTDRATPVNLSQHSYFNLAGTAAEDILGHELMIDADGYTPVDNTLIPTGEIAPVVDTPFDFTTPVAIGERIESDHPQLAAGGGYDHNFVLNRTREGLVHVAQVYEPISGRLLDISTTEPGLQFYSGNFLDGTITGKGGRVYGHRSGFCLETQHFPDSPNQAVFPSTILRPDAAYESRTVFRFGVRD